MTPAAMGEQVTCDVAHSVEMPPTGIEIDSTGVTGLTVLPAT